MGGFEFPKEAYELTKSEFGPRRAKFVLGLLIVTLVAGSVAAIVTSVGIVSKAIEPLTARIPTLPPGAATAAVSATVTLVIIGLIGVLAYRRVRDWSRVFSLAIDKLLAVRLENVNRQFDGANRRLERLEHNSAALASLNEAMSNLDVRVSSLEAPYIRTAQSEILQQLLSEPTIKAVGPSAPPFPAILKWTHDNCSGITIENLTPTDIEADVIVKALDRWSEKHVQFLPGDLADNVLPGKLTGGSRLVKPEPRNPVSYTFIPESGTSMLRLPLQSQARVTSLRIQQRGRWRATVAILLADGTERDFYAPFEWTQKSGVPVPDGPIQLAALQSHHDLKPTNIIVSER